MRCKPLLKRSPPRRSYAFIEEGMAAYRKGKKVAAGKRVGLAGTILIIFGFTLWNGKGGRVILWSWSKEEAVLALLFNL